MSYKKYRMWQAIIGMIIGGVVGVSIALDNWIIPICAIIIGLFIAIMIRRNVKEVVTDERTYAAAFKAARFRDRKKHIFNADPDSELKIIQDYKHLPLAFIRINS